MSNLPQSMDVFSSIPFPNIQWWVSYVASLEPVIDIGEHFQKHSYRNRYYVGTANGIQMLSIPIVKGRSQRSAMKDIEISYAEDWQKIHWRSIESAYMRTPFFEYYMDRLSILYKEKIKYLSDWNQLSIDMTSNILKLEKKVAISKQFISDRVENDWRVMNPRQQYNLIHKKEYVQPFIEKLGFLPNLSIIDLVSCEGPNSIQYLKSIQLIH